ncbi:DUF6011 domain-containing protein [Mycolicibacterium fortuitum]|uniref:DUF6011 domain-containing protein n=1 Tax=Mycolicibacterium fortuitum TaxID=1766 RepID=UPI00399B03FE
MTARKTRPDIGAGTPELRVVVRCSGCGRWLVAPQSVERGVGPKCQGGADE